MQQRIRHSYHVFLCLKFMGKWRIQGVFFFSKQKQIINITLTVQNKQINFIEWQEPGAKSDDNCGFSRLSLATSDTSRMNDWYGKGFISVFSLEYNQISGVNEVLIKFMWWIY